MTLRRARAASARRQAAWLVQIDPWRSLGYRARAVGAWLASSARSGWVTEAVAGGEVVGLIVAQPEVLLGTFIALLAVRPERAGRGVGRALVTHVARRAFARRRWLYTSSGASNRGAARFYRRLGFVRVGRLPDLIAPGQVEILWRRGRRPL